MYSETVSECKLPVVILHHRRTVMLGCYPRVQTMAMPHSPGSVAPIRCWLFQAQFGSSYANMSWCRAHRREVSVHHSTVKSCAKATLDTKQNLLVLARCCWLYPCRCWLSNWIFIICTTNPQKCILGWLAQCWFNDILSRCWLAQCLDHQY